MDQHNINIEKTGRYFTIGSFSEQVENVWFVCHGYGRLGNYFLKNFESIVSEDTLIVSCEGLHRFYTEGFAGRIGASWMTKEDRLNDIKDYVNYLDKVYEEVNTKINLKSCTVNVLGFSQGGATVCRWMALGKAKANNLILWASVFPPDLDFNNQKQILKNITSYLLCGDEDEFASKEQIDGHLQLLRENNIPFEFIPFKGKHKIYKEVLIELRDKLKR
jgi:predicted esterase